MNRSHLLLVSLSEQMYRDVRFITQSNPTVVVDEETVRMFNSLLLEVRKAYPHAVEAIAFEEMTARTLKYKDALLIVGQLACLVRVMAGVEPVPAAAAPVPPSAPVPAAVKPVAAVATGPVIARSGQRVGRQEAAASSQDDPSDHDLELYGPVPPVHLNEDGTVKFSLD